MENPQQLLWEYVQKYINIKRGYLIADDTILDKPRGPKIEGVGFHYCGKTQTFSSRMMFGQFGVEGWKTCVSH